MSELERSAGDRMDGGGVVWDDELPVADVRQLFVTLGKAFRAYQLYDENNPVRRRFLDGLRNEFQRLWEELDRVVVSVNEDHFYLQDQTVYQSDSRADSLAFLFFKDGIREITFLPGIEGEELERFLGVLQRARKLVPEGDDLLTVLWEEDLRYFQYQYVDLLAEGVSLPEAGPGNAQSELQAVLEDEVAEEDKEGGAQASDQPPQPQTVKQDDFNPTLYALDAREMEKLKAEVKKELARDTRGDVLSALFDRLEEHRDRDRQLEILRILGTLLPNFLSRGALVPATRVLEELRTLERLEGALNEEGLAELRSILLAVSASDTLNELIKALYDGTIRATPTQLAGFLTFLRAGALPALLHAAESVEHKELRSVLRAAVQGIARKNRGAVLRLLEDQHDPVLAAGAARLVGDIQVTEAAPALTDLLAHPVAAVRLATVEAAVSLRASTVAGALEHTLDDPDRDVRVAAAKALGTLQYRPAVKTLAEIVGGKTIRGADIGEKVAVFEAYGAVAGPDGIRLLDGLLNGKSFLGKREPSEVRAAAALGLGRIATPEAKDVLRKALDDEDPVVRSNANRAFRRDEG